MSQGVLTMRPQSKVAREITKSPGILDIFVFVHHLRLQKNSFLSNRPLQKNSFLINSPLAHRYCKESSFVHALRLPKSSFLNRYLQIPRWEVRPVIIAAPP